MTDRGSAATQCAGVGTVDLLDTPTDSDEVPPPADVLTVGPESTPSTRSPRRRWAARGAAAVAVVAVVAAAAVDLGLVEPSPPSTGVRLLTTGSHGLQWVDVDSGSRSPVGLPSDIRWTDPLVVGGHVVLRYLGTDPGMSDQVVAFDDGQQPTVVGEADEVVPGGGGSIWLVVAGHRRTPGGVALTSPRGTWRSRVRPIPTTFDVVGSVGNRLVVADGAHRYRRVLLWDVQEQRVVRRFGLVVGVRDVAHGRAVVTIACLTFGCGTAVIDLRDGRTTTVSAPAGYVVSGAPSLTPTGVAMIVLGGEGAVLAAGAPDDLSVIDLGTHDPARGASVFAAGRDWLAVPMSDGDVALWRDGLDPALLPSVHLEPDEAVIAAAG